MVRSWNRFFICQGIVNLIRAPNKMESLLIKWERALIQWVRALRGYQEGSVAESGHLSVVEVDNVHEEGDRRAERGLLVAQSTSRISWHSKMSKLRKNYVHVVNSVHLKEFLVQIYQNAN